MSSFINPEYNHYFENYPYELSDFQKHAIKAIVDGNHVLVTAHTGSGKTLPAEFAIRHFVNQGKKVIYTSPIKALSNQKYYEFSRKFPDITFGLLTGDIKTNPSADVLIMTTEILMNKLFRMHDVAAAASRLSFEMDIERDLAAVVFDECHYINDADRGHVWEQCILMLPTQVQMVLLSATIDNPSGFARWITESKGASKTALTCLDDKTASKAVIICSTNHRVVPLTHYMFVTTPEGLHKKINDKTVSAGLRKTFNTCLTIQDSEGAFNAQNYSEVGGILRLMDKHGISTTRKHVLNTLIDHMKGGTIGSTEGSSMLPAIVFVFSRKLVEQCAEEVTVPLFTVDDPDTIDIPYHKIRHECMTIIRRLPNWKEYAELPEYMRLVNLLEKGIGIHHSGMLPVLKEIVELMISKKYIRVLFATESFAIGLDCPIKSAVFISLKKFASSGGGSAARYLLSHEYTQMAGRAGRRGIDTIGNVIHCVNLFEHATLPTQITYSEILGGKPQRLVSKFKIDYKMIMNLLCSNFEETPSSLEEVKVPLSSTFDLINKSMMSSEMASMERGIKQDIAEYEKKISDLQEQFLGTPIEILQEYCKMQEIRPMASNKKLKEIDTACSALLKAHATMVADLRVYKELTSCETELASRRSDFTSMTNYSQTCVKTVLNVLADRGIVDVHSEKGVICSSIAEVNPLLMTSLFEEYKDFAEFSPEMLAGLLTLFTDVRIPSGKEDGIQVDTYFLDKAFSQFARVCDDLADCEHAHGIKDPVNTDQHLDASLIADDVIDWCRSQTEEDCKLVLHHLTLYKGVSVGDFTKALLKISTVVRELISVCEKTGKIELMSRLSQIDPLILKHVTTNQSLYL
jgi:superfamily II RNA helicase